MRQEEFEKIHSQSWKKFALLVQKFELKSAREDLPTSDVVDLPKMYKSICHSLSIAKERQYSPALIEYLDGLALQGHQLVYRRNTHFLHDILNFIYHGFSQQIQKYRVLFWITTGVFYGPALILYSLTLFYPDLIYSLLPAQEVARFESMYDPEVRVLGRERESDSDFLMFGHYIQNNIGIAFRTFATGILFTLGSFFFLIFNGVFFGAVTGHIVNLHYNSTFFPFVIGHGSFELTAIIISGMAGILVGWSIIAPGNLSRFDSLKIKAQEAMKLMYGAFLMLVIAAFIEAFWSSSTNLSNDTKYIVGSILWGLVLTYLLYPRRVTNES